MNKSKLKKIGIILLLVIVIPIVFNKVKTAVTGVISAKMRMRPVNVETVKVEERDIYPSSETAGRLNAKYEVAVVARINGWLQKSYFKEGDTVKKGQVLFLIEPDEYALAVRNAQATVNAKRAAYLNSEKNLKRAAELVKGDYVSKSYYDDALASRDANKGALDAALADLNRKKLDLSYTRVVSPIDGKIGKILITQGNYVTAQTGTIAKIVSVDPIYASFTVKSSDLSKMNKNAEGLPDVKVEVKTSDNKIYSRQGKLDFVDNSIDINLGTIGLRATFPNPDAELIPNDFVRVITTSNKPVKTLLIPQNAVMENVNSPYVWVIDENSKAKQVNIQTGSQYEDFWIVTEGLNAGQKVISSGLQTMREGAAVTEVENASEQQK